MTGLRRSVETASSVRKPLAILNTTFTRLVLTFLSIMIPMYALGIFIFNWSTGTVKNEISKSAVTHVSSSLEGLEKEISRIKTLQYDCMGDENLNMLAVRWEILPDYERVRGLLQLRQRLYSIRNSSACVKSVIAYILPIGKMVSADEGVSGIDQVRLQKARLSFNAKSSQILPRDGGLFLVPSKQGDFLGFDPLFILEIELDTSALSDMLFRFGTYADGGIFLMDPTNDLVILSSSDAGDPSAVSRIAASGNRTGFSRLDIGSFYVVSAESEYLNLKLVKYIPEAEIRKPLDAFFIWSIIFTGLAIVMILIYAVWTFQFIHKPLDQLVSAFRLMERGEFTPIERYEKGSEFSYLYARFNIMIENVKNLIDQVYTQKILAQRSELKQLQAQINPHFLYNSFFALNAMVKTGDYENLEEFTKLLGDYFQFITRNAPETIPLEKEINHARAYARIQEMRFSKRIKIFFGEPCGELSDLQVPRLIIQPLIENAFTHGLEKKTEKGLVEIRFAFSVGRLEITVQDNGDGLSDEDIEKLRSALEDHEPAGDTTGIINIHRRIRIMFGEGSGLSVSRSGLGGLRETILIVVPDGER